jgi:catechol 2,3-dioxygenase-like lactoylglutathione lyase family enzyme
MSILGFLHAALAVTDLEVSQRFYEGVLGLIPIPRPFGFPGMWYQIGSVQLHLIQTEHLIPDLVNAEKWGRNRHLAFAVSDLAEIHQQLLQKGYAVQRSASGRAALFVTDPDGHLIELSQADLTQA